MNGDLIHILLSDSTELGIPSGILPSCDILLSLYGNRNNCHTRNRKVQDYISDLITGLIGH